MSEYQYHPVTLASDTTDMQAGTLTRIADAVRLGLPSAAISGGLSMYNTFIDYGNMLGLTNKEQVNTESLIRQYDTQMGDYYAENKGAIDLVGFVGASIVPGSLAVKGIQLARAGNALGSFGKYLNLANTKRAEYLEKALQETARSGGTMKSILDSTRRAELAWGAADQAMLAAAAELAIVATMNDSPVFEGDTFGDFVWNMGLGVALGGTIGGALSGLTSRGILKDAQQVVQSQLRAVDTVFSPKNMGMTPGSDIFLTTENILKVSESVPGLSYEYMYDGVKKAIQLDTGEAVKAAADRAIKSATQDVQLAFNRMAGGNANIGQAYFEFIQEGIQAAKAAGKDNDEIASLIFGWLGNVNKIDSLDLDRIAINENKFYVNLAPAGDTPVEKLADIFSPKRTATAKQAYRMADDVLQSDVKIAKLEDLGEVNLRQAFRNNTDIDIIQMPDGSVRVNPKSERVLRVNEKPFEFKQFLDLESGSLSSETVPHIGDLITTKGAQYATDFIQAGGRTFRQAANVATKTLEAPLDASARWAWASALEPAQIVKITGNRVDLNDLPVLARLVELEPQLARTTLEKMKFIDGQKEMTIDELVSLNQVLDNKRYQLIQERLAEVGDKGLPVPETRVLAAQINTSRQWVEEAIQRNFRPAKPNEVTHGVAYTTAEALKPRNLEMTWDFSPVGNAMLPDHAFQMNMGPMHLVTQKLNAHYQYATRDLIGKNAMNAALGVDAKLFLQAEADTAMFATNEGAGASLFGSSNAGYGEKAKLWVQDTGKNVALATQRRRDAAVETLAPHVNAIREDPRAAAELGILTTALRKSEHRYIMTDSGLLVAKDAYDLANARKIDIEEAATYLDKTAPSKSGSQRIYQVESKAVRDFLRTSTKMNAERQDKLTTLYNAAGVTRDVDVRTIYVPPINTVRYPYHAFVRTKERIGVASDVTMITAKSEEQLRQLAAKVGDDFDVIYKGDTEAYFKAKGEYEYDMTLHDARVDSELARKGVLADFFPETRAENVLTDWLDLHAKAEEKLVRTAVQVGNRRFFNEMQFLSENYRKVSESVTRGIGSRFKSKVADPFGDYIKTALNISKQQEFPLLDSLNDFVDKLGLKAGEAINKAFYDARNDLLPWEDANKIMEGYGFKGLYPDLDAYIAANQRYPRNVIREVAQKANMALATTLLRLDFANSLLNIISTPIMLGTEMQSIKGLIGKDAKLAGKLAELTSIKVPGRDLRVPSTTQLIAESINDFFGPNKNQLLSRYKDIGAVKEVSQLYHEMLDDLSFDPTVNPSKWKERVERGVEIGAKIAGNTFAEDFTRFVSANVMRRLSDPVVEAGKMSVKEQNAYISTFVNRVQGNYVTSQRPIIFQGTTGAAVSLFQTYAFNVLQQLHRHIQAGDKKTLAVFAGLQGSIFGLNGLPFFDAINTHIIGSWVANNPEHKDAYSVLPGFNKEVGDWMLYGTASAFPLFTGSFPALYTRGDINPRHITILPTNFTDIPAVAASLKLVDTVVNTGKNIMAGADTSDALLRGLEHQGWNRPLAGFAQLLGGRSTTSKGALVSAANDMEATSWLGALAERTVEYGGVSRLMGARPMDEAVALNQLYRNKTYEAIDRARIERLGQVVKTKLYNNEVPDQEELEDFMLRYARAGGDIKNFSQAMQRWMRDANVSTINQTASRLGDPYAQTLQTIMGGERISDYRSQFLDTEE